MPDNHYQTGDKWQTEELCEDCPPRDYPTDETRCRQCPLRRYLANGNLISQISGSGE